MRRLVSRILLALFPCLLGGADWLQFRGPDGTSVSRDASPPTSWSDNENVAWKAVLPGRGPSSPIVVQGKVVVTASSGPKQDRLHVLSFDHSTGRELWRREFWATGRTLTHPFSAVAAPTPASDGKRIFAFYSSNDLICLDLDGNLLWYRGLAFDYPKAGNDAGMASSPVVAADTVVVQIENQGDSFAIGLDVATGETRWRIPREAVGNWSSPVVLPCADPARPSVLLQSASGVAAVDAQTGEELWRYAVSCATMPSPAVSNGRIFIPANGLTVLELPSGNRAPALAWDSNRLGPNPSSPIVDGNRVYVMNGAGVLTCADAQDGKILWQMRIGGRHWSTPAAAGNCLYCINENGQARVVELGNRGAIVASHEFGETILSSPAIADGALYVRSDRHLWKIARGW